MGVGNSLWGILGAALEGRLRGRVSCGTGRDVANVFMIFGFYINVVLVLFSVHLLGVTTRIRHRSFIYKILAFRINKIVITFRFSIFSLNLFNFFTQKVVFLFLKVFMLKHRLIIVSILGLSDLLKVVKVKLSLEGCEFS